MALAEIADLDVEFDSGPRAHTRARLCVATRTVLPEADLIRFVIGPNGEAVPDVKRKLPGRGIWVTATQDALAEAIRCGAFARSFRREVRTPADLVSQTEHLLERSALDALAIASKAGLAATGFSKVEAALADAEVVALLHASEASAEGVRKLSAATRRRRGAPVVVIGFLTSTQLDLALNRPNVVHAALLAGSASDTFLARCLRLKRFRTGDQIARAEQAALS
jgi:uncharacterized protein